MQPTRRRLGALVAAAAFLLTACDAADDTVTSTVPPSSTPAATAVPSTTPAPAASPAPSTTVTPPDVGRLVVLDESGNVATMSPDGSDLVPLTTDGGSEAGYFQPTWSPSADAVAVTRADADGFAVVRFDVATGTTAEVPTDSNAFYVYWSPAGDRLGYLSTGPTALALRLVDFDDPGAGIEIDLGQPFYFAWSPDGERMATLIGQQRFDVRTPGDDTATAAIAAPGAFQNPIWTDAGIFYVGSGADSDQLLLGLPGGEAQILARSQAPIIMTAPASGERVAVQAIGDADGVAASFQEAPLLALNKLLVIEVESGEIATVSDTPALAYFWDPAGEQLLVLGDNPDTPRLRWSVWRDGELRHLTDVLPTRGFADNYLPFFGQYALSTTLWAPDGSAFAFAGFVENQGGIYVQNVDGGDPILVGEGTWVMWSPR